MKGAYRITGSSDEKAVVDPARIIVVTIAPRCIGKVFRAFASLAESRLRASKTKCRKRLPISLPTFSSPGRLKVVPFHRYLVAA